MPFFATRYLYKKAVGDVAQKLRRLSRASELTIQAAAEMQVNDAYYAAAQHHLEHVGTAQDEHRAALIQLFTGAGVTKEIAAQIVEKDVLHAEHS